MSSPINNRIFSGIRFEADSGRAIYLQLSDAILLLIRNGNLRTGQRLPATRHLATMLNLNRITVSKAYEELQLQGWLQGFVGRGTYVADHIPERAPRALRNMPAASGVKRAGYIFDIPDYIDRQVTLVNTPLHLDDGFPDVKLAPLKELYRAYRAQLTRSGLYHKFGVYGSPEGAALYRDALSRYLNETRGLKTTAANVLSVKGTVMGLNLVCNALIRPGDVIVSGIPGWMRAERNFLHAGAKHIGIPVDQHGLVVDELRKICRKRKVRMVYVTPHHHYPTTVSLRIDRRLELLNLASEYGFIIFEDDYDFDFHYRQRPLMPLASADSNGMVIYCGSFSKSFSPAFRMGYLVAPEDTITYLGRVRMLLDRQGDHTMDNAMGDLLNDGTVQRYLRRTLTVYKERRDFFCNQLQTTFSDLISFEVPEGGLSVWATLARHINPSKLAAAAYAKGLFMSDGSAHRYPGLNLNAIRLGFASSDPVSLKKSINIMKEILQH